MREARRLSARGRRKRFRECEGKYLEQVTKAGLSEDSAMADEARDVGRLEFEHGESEQLVRRTGRLKRSGEVSAAWERLLALGKELREARRSFHDRLSASSGVGGVHTLESAREAISRIASRVPGALDFVVKLDDGLELEDVAVGARGIQHAPPAREEIADPVEPLVAPPLDPVLETAAALEDPPPSDTEPPAELEPVEPEAFAPPPPPPPIQFDAERRREAYLRERNTLAFRGWRE
jgi:hypothetical protein